jgi:rhamnogalacturonan endolyase
MIVNSTALGVFGQYEQDGIVVSAGATKAVLLSWVGDSSGTELWRLGTPDKSAGEFKHGYALDTTHPRQPEQHRI